MSKKSKKNGKKNKDSKNTEKVEKKSKKKKGKEKKEKKHVPEPRVDADGNVTLNENEYLVLKFAKKHKDGVTLKEIAAKVFKKKAGKYGKSDASKGGDKAHSWARNSVRKPQRIGLLKHTDRGTYQITKTGKSAI